MSTADPPEKSRDHLSGTDEGSAGSDFRIVALVVALTWGGLMLLAFMQERFIGPSPQESVFCDVAVHARYLVALPLLLSCSGNIDARLRECLEQFRTLELIDRGDRPAFESAVDKAFSGRGSWSARAVCMVLAVVWVLLYANSFSSRVAPQIGANWHSIMSESGPSRSAAGWWYLVVCQSLYAFVALTVVHRAGLLWLLFLRISRLKLNLNALHGDHAAGLGFIANLLRPLRVPVFAISASAAGTLADLILFGGGDFVDFLPAIGTFSIVVCLLLAGPIMLFSDAIRGERRKTLLRHGAVVATRATEVAKVTSDAPDAAVIPTHILNASNELLQNVRATRPLIQRAEFAKLVGVSLLPFAAVATLQLPLGEIVGHLRFFLR